MRARRSTAILVLFTTLPLLSSCGLIDRIRGGDEDEASEDAEADADAEAGNEADAEAGNEAGTDEADAPAARPMPTGLDRFKHWAPRHEFIGVATTTASAISETELIVATADNHVGVSTDGGQSWQWTKAPASVRRVAGYPGGPYFLLHDDDLSMSQDGMTWVRLPRLVEDSLIDMVASDVGLIAAGKSGGYAFYGKDGSAGSGGSLPDKFKPKYLTELNGAVLAISGKKGYGTTDGSTWTELEQLPPLGDGKSFLTSAGKCSLGKVGKRKGVACSVSGTAYGIGDEFIVENKGVVSLTRDGGETWLAASLPFKSANAVFGSEGGPYFAVGNSGAVAISKDGLTWVDQKWEESANLLSGAADGNKVVIGGAKGTIIFSTDGGTSWDYAEPPLAKSFSWVGVSGGSFLASDGRAFVASENLSEWYESEGIELPGKAGPCDEGPNDTEVCKYDADVTTPEDLPDVRSVTFTGDVGVALGDHALIAVTNDGGATWTSSHGFDLGRGGLGDFDVDGDNVIVSDGVALFTSADAGASWVEGELLRKYKINDVHVSAEGVWLAAVKDDIIAAKLSQETWLPAGEDQLKGDWRAFFEVNGVLYAAGSKGQLLRSEDASVWTEVITERKEQVLAMAGEGDEVWLVTAPSRKSSNRLFRSQDGGRTFAEVMEMTSATERSDLDYAGGTLTWLDLVSRDGGESWQRETKRYFSGAVDVADGSGMQIANFVSRYGPDSLYVITGEGEYDWVRIDSAYTEGGAIQCTESSGCWMLAGGSLYRPLGR